MCVRCREIELGLVRLRRLHADTKDRLALVLLGDTIKDLESEILALHPNTDANIPEK